MTSNINKAFLEDELLQKMHMNKQFKPYVVGSLYPLDMQTKMYKMNQVYVLHIRSIDKEFLNRLKNSFKKANELDFKVISIEFKRQNYGFIDSVYTLTPVIMTINDELGKVRYWTKEEESLDFVRHRIKNNLERKYFDFFGKNIVAPSDFVQSIQLHNKKPIVFNYKGSRLFANKFKFSVNNDKISQELIKLGFGVGILEKNSLGFGFLTRGK